MLFPRMSNDPLIGSCLGGPDAAAWRLIGEDPLAWDELRASWALNTRARARYAFRAAKSEDAAEILLYGPIGADFFGDGIGAKKFSAELRKLGSVKTINLRIDSPGGMVSEARAIYTQLVEHSATINVFVDGLAASAASFIAMAGDKISVAEGGFIMIHEARGVAVGTSAAMLKAAEVLKAMTSAISDTYVARTGNARKKVDEWMRAETWFDGKTAVQNGFADELLANKTAKTATAAYSAAFEAYPRRLLPRSTKARNILKKMERASL
jgi:ATP-dependent protease ClpP protease subunit